MEGKLESRHTLVIGDMKTEDLHDLLSALIHADMNVSSIDFSTREREVLNKLIKIVGAACDQAPKKK